mmetsp:Transcript_19070/g.35592  ORF Transcript_19070/g.35592 Transcript_19070/m.35592 type:complete len:191 (-) Transcript_19070:567-1139(-)|eukprot:CAMPEP_0178734478 /NCGR_PEP_ID=MMETSP0744-20121128/1364_1 /TAXON_ID=913974 /ORGANISM="Nitzschia punctata, Strain CCMP561" /LENGTH=190 /DNA_ID=CAMNT_0020386759 /DNA_START=257 /DNA_END=829 /DNA_ORIENTATION=+
MKGTTYSWNKTKTEESTTDTLRPFDVLCGRDRRSFNHVGNRRFRVIISMNLERYLAATSRRERSEMILSLTRELVQEAGIRFLKQEQGESCFIELNETAARAKVGHSLRDQAAANHVSSTKNRRAPKKVPPSLGNTSFPERCHNDDDDDKHEIEPLMKVGSDLPLEKYNLDTDDLSLSGAIIEWAFKNQS